MYLNEFATGVDALDMTQFDEFASLLRSAADLGIPHSPEARYVSRNAVINHLRFHFLEWGDPSAPPVLLLHGGNQSGHSWDLVSLHLADRFHVYALDQRGHGDSEWTRESDYSSEAMAADALAFLAQEGVTAPIVMGHSMGGIVTMTLTVRQPETPRAVVIVDSGPQFEAEGAKTIRMYGRDVPVRAKVASIRGLSAHGDCDDMIAWLKSAPTPPKKTFLVHGEADALQEMGARVSRELGYAHHTPDYMETVEL